LSFKIRAILLLLLLFFLLLLLLLSSNALSTSSPPSPSACRATYTYPAATTLTSPRKCPARTDDCPNSTPSYPVYFVAQTHTFLYNLTGYWRIGDACAGAVFSANNLLGDPTALYPFDAANPTSTWGCSVPTGLAFNPPEITCAAYAGEQTTCLPTGSNRLLPPLPRQSPPLLP